MDQLIFSVSDGTGSDQITVNVTITPVNDSPHLIISMSDIERDEDFETFTINLNSYFDDVDDDVLLYSVSTNPAGRITATTAANVLTIENISNENGPVDITITADDQYVTKSVKGVSIQEEFRLTINEINDKPVNTLEPVVTATEYDFAYTNSIEILNNTPEFNPNDETKLVSVNEDSDVNFVLSMTDKDDDETYNWTNTTPAHGAVVISEVAKSAKSTIGSKNINYTPDANFNGDDSFEIQVTDANDETSFDVITINVTVYLNSTIGRFCTWFNRPY